MPTFSVFGKRTSLPSPMCGPLMRRRLLPSVGSRSHISSKSFHKSFVNECKRNLSSSLSVAIAQPSPKPARRSTFSVPARRPCSCPAPCINTGKSPGPHMVSRRYKQPTPLGAYILCAASVNISTSNLTTSTSTLPTLCEASV